MPDIAEPKTENVKERPATFNGWSIRGILDERKTQMRRIMKPQPPETMPEDSYLDAYSGGPEWCAWTYQDKVHNSPEYGGDGSCMWTCPYGKPGDVIWVREAFRLPVWADQYSPLEYVETGGWIVRYEAGGHHSLSGAPDHVLEESAEDVIESDYWGRKRPSIHMPKEMCRLYLRVEDVRVERVKSISREDAVAEGVRKVEGVEVPGMAPAYEDVLSGGDSFCFGAQAAFMRLCHNIHGQGAWRRNDRVWVIEFSRINDTSR